VVSAVHAARLEFLGLGAGPLLTIRQSCACGVVVSERVYDLREGWPVGVGGDGDDDARAFLGHLAEAGFLDARVR